MEKWKPIKGFEGLYEVSNHGRVKSLRRRFLKSDGVPMTVRERILKNVESSNGYLTASLSNGVVSLFTIHRLVAIHFVANPKGKNFVNHKDGNKKNNHASNLEWVTKRENNIHAIENGLINTVGEANKMAKLTKKKVLQIRRLASEKVPQRKIAAQFNIGQQTVSDIHLRKKWKHI